MKKFPWDCDNCPLLVSWDMSCDDITHKCLWSKRQIDDCDRWQYAECPLEKHDADERQKVIESISLLIRKEIENLEERESSECNEGRQSDEKQCRFAIDRLEILAEQIK